MVSKSSLAESLTAGIVPVPKKIRLRKQRSEIAAEIARTCNVSPITAKILAARGHEPGATLKHYLEPTLREGIPTPEKLKNLSAATELIASIVKAKGKIAICCDFDVDGLSGGAQVYDLFKRLGIDAQVHVPDRFEDGYGLNQKMIRKIAENGCALVITIDFGTTNTVELTLARELGLKTIVIDHHHVGDHVPPADIFINPNQKGCGFAGGILCASGLAWYLVVALRGVLPGGSAIDAKSYLELACLGTICDMVPLQGANRVIAKRGLEALEVTTRPGLVALKNVIGIKRRMSCTDVSFGIGPRLNAAGRLIHGDLVIDLLTTKDASSANTLARQLHELNAERQEAESEVKFLALEQIKKRGSIGSSIVVWDPSFHTGVIGIVAQRLVETFYRPSAVMGADANGILKGSVRGIKL